VVHSFGGQTITAHAVEVSARDGRTASLWNTGLGSQSVTASNGAGVDVVVGSGGGLANIQADAGSSQSVTVIDGDHINVNAASGNAFITVPQHRAQTLSITGSGRNAIHHGQQRRDGWIVRSRGDAPVGHRGQCRRIGLDHHRRTRRQQHAGPAATTTPMREARRRSRTSGLIQHHGRQRAEPAFQLLHRPSPTTAADSRRSRRAD
jgi:hypothetical protein